MTWVVTVHDGGGSMAEAMDVEWAIQLSSQKEAEDFANVLNGNLAKLGEDYKMAQAFEVLPTARHKLPRLSAVSGASPTAPGHIAIDMRELARKIHEGEEIEVLPPPPPPVPEDEVQAALESLRKDT